MSYARYLSGMLRSSRHSQLFRLTVRIIQDRFLDDLHTQLMESHRDLLLEKGVDTKDIPAPDLCFVGEFLGPVGT